MTRRLALLLCLLPLAAAAQQSAPPGSFSPAQRAEIIAIVRQALQQDPSILRDAVTALQQEEQDKDQASASKAIAANRAAIFNNPADPVLGNPAGHVTLVAFFDVRCPYCRRMRPEIDALLAKNHDVRIVMKDLPILGPASILGSRALLAAQAQGGYAKLQAALMREGVTVDEPTIHRAADTLGLDWASLRTAMNQPALQQRLDANVHLAILLGIHGTPALIYGDQMASGALSPDELDQAVAASRQQ